MKKMAVRLVLPRSVKELLSAKSAKQVMAINPPQEGSRSNANGNTGATSSFSPPTFVETLARLRVPDHELIRRIGSGAYGEVWLARNVVGTLRAVKVVHRCNFSEAYPFEREFKGIQKYEPISRGHEGLIDILQIGRNDEAGYFYYVMELADDAAQNRKPEIGNPKEARNSKAETSAEDQPIRTAGFGFPSDFGLRNSDLYSPRTLRHDLKQHGRLTPNECLRIGLMLSSGLEHLQQQGLVHRDIKPSNIIFVNGAPKLADIGLVADVDEARSFVGTVGFIPPEGPGTAQADVYGLGKVLYEMLTGKDRQEFPALPDEFLGSTRDSCGRLRPGASGEATFERRLWTELNQITLRACESDTRRRYPSAQAMHDELALWERGQSVKRKRAVDRCLGVFKNALLMAVLLAAILGGTRFASKALFPAEYGHKPSSNDEATDLYKRGWYVYQKKTEANMKLAIARFEEAIAKDPKYAAAHAALANSYCWSLGDLRPDYGKAREHAEKALALDRKLPEAHKALALLKWLDEWDFPNSEEEFKLAINLAPHDAAVHEMYGCYLLSMGRVSESIKELKEAEWLDGISLSIPGLLAGAYSCNNQDELAVKGYKYLIAMETNAPSFAYFGLASLYEDRGEFLSAISLNEQWHQLNGENAEAVAQKYDALREAFGTGGPRGYWEKQIKWAEDEDQDHYTQARFYARVGNKEKAFELLEITRAEHDASIVVKLRTDPAMETLRSDPRYAQLLKELKWN
jgi:serine/threonine protein kinase/Tfp pilus assembly protein PilF